uniref:Uncharacterized protein n=1 Tax=Takifugu rubripes TaxID=31033 RepID=A0A674NIF6_TAKRU
MADDLDIEALLEAPYRKVSTSLTSLCCGDSVGLCYKIMKIRGLLLEHIFVSNHPWKISLNTFSLLHEFHQAHLTLLWLTWTRKITFSGTAQRCFIANMIHLLTQKNLNATICCKTPWVG